MTEASTQPKRRTLQGTITSDKMDKTRVVAVTRQKKHPKYLKYFKTTTKFMAHDETNAYKAGDFVVIQETRPRSANKRWEITGYVDAK